METNNALLILLKKIFYFSIFLFSISPLFSDSVYLGIEPEKYLIGDFSSETIFQKFEGKKDRESLYLRKDVIRALNKMIEDFDRERESKSKQHIFLISAFRSFSNQKRIWEGKYKGNIKMRESVKGKSPSEIISMILQYSSAPGTSRHHWGTDFDINVLKNDYYRENGNGTYLYNWLKKNAARYGFCQPYNEYEKRNSKGYLEERWHWSYAPIANKLAADWVKYNKNGKLNFTGKFIGSEHLKNLSENYVTSFNKECNEIRVSHLE